MIYLKVFYVLCAVGLFYSLLRHKGFKRGRKTLYPKDDRVKWNFKAKRIRIIKVVLSGGDLIGQQTEAAYYEIWERKFMLFSVRYDARDYHTLEEAKREVQNIIEYVEITTSQKEMI